MSEDKDKQARASSSGAVNLMAGVGERDVFLPCQTPDEIKHDILFRAMFCIYIIKYLL